MKFLRKSLNSIKSEKGFTLIELLIVIIILAVLAGLALPIYTAQVERSRAAEAIQSLDGMRASMLRYFAAQPTPTYVGAALGTIDYNPNTVVGGQTLLFSYAITSATATTFLLTASRVGGPVGTVTINQAGVVTRTGVYV